MNTIRKNDKKDKSYNSVFAGFCENIRGFFGHSIVNEPCEMDYGFNGEQRNAQISPDYIRFHKIVGVHSCVLITICFACDGYYYLHSGKIEKLPQEAEIE